MPDQTAPSAAQMAPLIEWLRQQASAAEKSAEHPAIGPYGAADAAFDRGAHHMASATLTWIFDEFLAPEQEAVAS